MRGCAILVTQSIRILHLEDNNNDAELIRRSLQNVAQSIEFVRVTNEQSYIEALTSSKFHVILADFSLPGFNGAAALQIAKDKTPDTPFIFVSGTIGEEQAIQMIKEGATDYILKGHLSALPQAIDRALREKEEREARKRAEESLLQAQKIEAVGQLAGGIAHDFNNILMAISGYCEVLQMKTGANSNLTPEISEILKAAERGAKLTRQLLTFSRKHPAAKQTLNLNEVVNGLKQMLRRLIAEGTDLEFDLAPNVSPIEADFGQLEQVIMNLVLNARDAVRMGSGKITIRTAETEITSAHSLGMNIQPGHYAVLSISDDGHGMSPEIKSKLFEPFFTTKEAGKGTGLGLSTVYGIVKESEGYIFVDSQAGIGSTFSIYFPPSSHRLPEHESYIDKSENAVGSQKRTILLVDDNATLLDALTSYLKIKGYDLLQASNGQEALLVAREFAGTIDAVITDLAMPTMDGAQFAAQLSAERPTTKFFLMSGYSGDLLEKSSALVNDCVILEKPIAFEELYRKIEQSLSQN